MRSNSSITDRLGYAGITLFVCQATGLVLAKLFRAYIGPYVGALRKAGYPLSFAVSLAVSWRVLRGSEETRKIIDLITPEPPSPKRIQAPPHSSTSSSSSSSDEEPCSPPFAADLKQHVLTAAYLRGKSISKDLSRFIDRHAEELEAWLSDGEWLIREQTGGLFEPLNAKRWLTLSQLPLSEAGEALGDHTLRALYHLALKEEGSIGLVKEIFNLKLYPERSFGFCIPPLVVAIEAKRADVVEELLFKRDVHPFLNKEFRLDQPIVQAAALGSPEIVRLLLKSRKYDETADKRYLKKALAIAESRATDEKIYSDEQRQKYGAVRVLLAAALQPARPANRASRAS